MQKVRNVFLNLNFFQVTRQLFEPLVMQLIHWFTNNKKFESQDTVAVLEAIMVSFVFVFFSYEGIDGLNFATRLKTTHQQVSLNPLSSGFRLSSFLPSEVYTWLFN